MNLTVYLTYKINKLLKSYYYSPVMCFKSELIEVKYEITTVGLNKNT